MYFSYTLFTGCVIKTIFRHTFWIIPSQYQNICMQPHLFRHFGSTKDLVQPAVDVKYDISKNVQYVKK